MAKLKWENADRRCGDPGAVVSVPDVRRPSRFVGPVEQAARKEAREQVRRERVAASEARDFDLVMRASARRVQERQATGHPPSVFGRAIMAWVEKTERK